uniref:C3H1-type domain-containing protein n=1 Tax=Oryza rufipogon TaxID=4529 RepID=A0A0E0QKK3_ORYRU
MKQEEDELAVDPGVGAVCDPVTKLRFEAIVCLLDRIPITLQQIDMFGQDVAFRTKRIGNIEALLDFLKGSAAATWGARAGAGEPIDASSPELHRLVEDAETAYRDVRGLQPRMVVQMPRVFHKVCLPKLHQLLVIARRLLAQNVALRRLLLQPVGCDVSPMALAEAAVSSDDFERHGRNKVVIDEFGYEDLLRRRHTGHESQNDADDAEQHGREVREGEYEDLILMRHRDTSHELLQDDARRRRADAEAEQQGGDGEVRDEYEDYLCRQLGAVYSGPDQIYEHDMRGPEPAHSPNTPDQIYVPCERMLPYPSNCDNAEDRIHMACLALKNLVKDMEGIYSPRGTLWQYLEDVISLAHALFLENTKLHRFTDQASHQDLPLQPPQGFPFQQQPQHDGYQQPGVPFQQPQQGGYYGHGQGIMFQRGGYLQDVPFQHWQWQQGGYGQGFMFPQAQHQGGYGQGFLSEQPLPGDPSFMNMQAPYDGDGGVLFQKPQHYHHGHVPSEKGAIQAKGKQKMREPKTVMCPDWCRTGHCSSGDGCEYAHSQDELRVIDARPKYRTEPCRYWLAGKGCWYGDKCRYKQHRLAREPLYVDPFLTGTTYDRFAD